MRSLGRVVTAPTNGSAGVITCGAIVLHHLLKISKLQKLLSKQFLISSGRDRQSFQKRGYHSPAAMGGWSGMEIGVSSAMGGSGTM